MISPTQMRAARAVLNLSQGQVAESVGIAANTLSKIESGQADPPASRIKEIQSFYESRGLEFTDHDGVKRHTTFVKTYEGQEGYWKFYDDVYATVKEHGGEILVSNVQEQNFIKWLGQEKAESHRDRMLEILEEKEYSFRILVQEGDDDLEASDFAQYRWTPKERFSEIPFYVYGAKLGILLFEEDNVSVFVIDNPKIADAYKMQFNVIWDQAIRIPGKGLE